MATHRRFDRTARLLGDEGIARLASSTVTVFGVGGVGSFAAEGLVRSGVGRVILVDYDRICVTNVNRQLHAMKGTLGKPKVVVMAERLRAINPDADVQPRPEFYGPATSARLLTPEPDVVIDAIDNVTAKMHLIATCVRERLRLVSCMGAAGRLDPTAVRVVDLAETRICPFARDLRKSLRKKHGLDCTQPTGVRAVYSEEAPHAPHDLAYDDGGFHCVCPGGDNGMNDCEHKHRVEGSVAFVPSAFGMAAASTAVKLLLGLALVVAAACGGGGGGGPIDAVVADAPEAMCTRTALTIDEFYTCRARLTCALLDQCFAGDPSLYDCDTLAHPLVGARTGDRPEAEAAVASGRARWDEDRAAACLAAMTTRGCGLVKYPPAQLACSGVVGLVPEGEACATATECAVPGAGCFSPDGACPTICGARATSGESCESVACRDGDYCVHHRLTNELRCTDGTTGDPCNFDEECDPGHYCIDAADDVNGRCVPAEPLGGACFHDRDCRDPLMCLRETFSNPGVCSDLRNPGAGCDGAESNLCFGGQYCDITAGNAGGQCRSAPNVDEFCGEISTLPTYCGADMACDGQRCRPLAGIGRPCEPSFPDSQITVLTCGHGLYCDAEITGAEEGRCWPVLPAGEQCNRPSQCASGDCANGVCQGRFRCEP